MSLATKVRETYNQTQSYQAVMAQLGISKSVVHYHLNKGQSAKLLRNRKKARLRKYNLIDGYKMMHGCAECGYDRHPKALHFHHTGYKNFSISDAVKRNFSFPRIFKEIAQCEVLCANCHMELHYEIQN